MFFSTNDFYEYLKADQYSCGRVLRDACSSNGKINKKRTGEVLKRAKKAVMEYELHAPVADLLSPEVAQREGGYTHIHVGKFYRPWDVVPKLRDFRAPVGDYSVGLEVEYGFASAEAAKRTIHFVANWRNIAIDREGGTYGVETTFPPMLYSKITGKQPVFKYLRHLKSVEDSGGTVRHDPGRLVGTHVNVGSGFGRIPGTLCNEMTRILSGLAVEEKIKYFGRRPYGYLYHQGSYIEFKLFNSTTDVKTVRRYINIAVGIMKVMENHRSSFFTMTRDEVVAALEEAYNLPV